jgi:hypothetical protein
MVWLRAEDWREDMRCILELLKDAELKRALGAVVYANGDVLQSHHLAALHTEDERVTVSRATNWDVH